MWPFLQHFGLAFVPLFVAVDALGVMPMFMSFTEDLSPERRQRLLRDATLTASAVGLAFMFGGQLLFRFLGITENDFRVAGGLLLLMMSIADILLPGRSRRDPNTDVGVVPLGIPLIVGPATLTTLLMCVSTYGYLVTVLALVSNLILAWLVFRFASVILRLIGEGAARAASKLASLLLAAIAVMMIRIGMVNIIARLSG